MISERIRNIPASPIRKLAPFDLEAKNRGLKVFHLNIGQPDIKTPDLMINAVKDFTFDVLAYGPSEGLKEYREKLPEYYRNKNIYIDAEDLLVTTAGSEAIYFALFATCNPGDEIIIPEPYYTNYNGFASMAGVNIVPVTCSIDDGFQLPEISEFEAKIGNKTKALVICNPNNPTGAVYTRGQLTDIAALAVKYDLFVIADEVYRDFVYDGLEYTSILELNCNTDNIIVIDSISKRYSACGARIGTFISRNRDLVGGVLKLAQARLCPPTLEQIAAKAAIDIPDNYYADICTEYKKRRDIVCGILENIPGVIIQKPSGAFYILAELPLEDAEDFTVFMLREFSVNGKTVMVAPAEGFYKTPGLGRNQVRIAYVLNESDLREAMDIFCKGLEVYNNRLRG